MVCFIGTREGEYRKDCGTEPKWESGKAPKRAAAVRSKGEEKVHIERGNHIDEGKGEGADVTGVAFRGQTIESVVTGTKTANTSK